MDKKTPTSPQRRSFLTSLNTRMAGLAAMAAGGAALVKGQSPAARWEPARHEKDDWLDKLPGKHRVVFDTTTPDGLGEALAFGGNYLRTNRSDYGLQNNDMAVVIVLRHRSTGFAFNDSMWTKYGAPMAARAKFEDPKSKQAPRANVYNAADYGELLSNRSTTLDSLAKQGVQFAVCSVATRNLAGLIAQAVGGKADEINTELIANLVGSSRMVPAGIVAVSRAQERGYTLVSS